MQVFGLPSQFASATKIAKHWPKRDSCKLAAYRTSMLKRSQGAKDSPLPTLQSLSGSEAAA